jgi:nucleoside-diphosphate-sugar epimerase
VEVIRGDLAVPETFIGKLPQMDAAVLLAASWGGETAYKANVNATHSILNGLDVERCKRVVYFSTASLLDREGQLLRAAESEGTGYINQKYLALQGIGSTRNASKVQVVFPTVVIGGDQNHPYSHVSKTLPQLLNAIRWLRFLKLDASFHLIHAFDLARAVAFLLDHEVQEKPFVLGYAALSAGEFLTKMGQFQGLWESAQLDLTAFVRLLPGMAGNAFTSWDRFCLQDLHFVYPVFDLAARLGPSGLESLEGILRSDPRIGKLGYCAPSRS